NVAAGGTGPRRAARSGRAWRRCAIAILSAPTTEPTAALSTHLGLDAVGVQPEQRRDCRGLANVLDRVVRNGKHVDALVDEDRDLAIHAGLEQALTVVEGDEHREHRDVLLDDCLRLDLLDDAPEGAGRRGIDR